MTGSGRVAAGIGLSRVFGLVREVLIAATIGLTGAGDAFRLAMRIPNIIQNLLGEGALGASFVPVYARLLEEEDDAEARRVAGGVLGMLAAAVTVIVAVLVLAAGPLVQLFGAGLGPETRELATSLMRITSVGIGLLGLSAWGLAILNSHRHYFLGYAAPVLWSLSQIAVLAIAALGGLGDPDTLARWLAIAMVVGSFAQMAVMVPQVRRLTQGVLPHLRRDGQIPVVLRRFVPAVGARGIVQISGFVDIFLAGMLVAGSTAALTLVLPLYLLPISLFGFSVATAELTEMSRQSDRADVVAGRVVVGLRKVALPAGLCVAVLTAAGTPVIETMYLWLNELLDRDSFSPDQATALGVALAVFALSLPAAMTARVSQNALYALGDATTPARVAAIRLIVMTAVSVLVMFQADRLAIVDGSVVGWDQLPHWAFWQPQAEPLRVVEGQATLGLAGLGVGTVAAALVEWALLRRALNRRLGQALRSDLALAVTAAGAGTAAVIGLVRFTGWFGRPIEGIILGIVAVGSYIGLLAFQGYRPKPTAPVG